MRASTELSSYILVSCSVFADGLSVSVSDPARLRVSRWRQRPNLRACCAAASAPPRRMGALAPCSSLRRHSKKPEKAPDDKEIAEEASKRIEVYVQKAVRTELESEAFLIADRKSVV